MHAAHTDIVCLRQTKKRSSSLGTFPSCVFLKLYQHQISLGGSFSDPNAHMAMMSQTVHPTCAVRFFKKVWMNRTVCPCEFRGELCLLLGRKETKLVMRALCIHRSRPSCRPPAPSRRQHSIVRAAGPHGVPQRVTGAAIVTVSLHVLQMLQPGAAAAYYTPR